MEEEKRPSSVQGLAAVVLLRGGFKVAGVIVSSESAEQTTAETRSMVLENVIFLGRTQMIRARDTLTLPGYLIMDMVVGSRLPELLKSELDGDNRAETMAAKKKQQQPPSNGSEETKTASTEEILSHFSNGKLADVSLVDQAEAIEAMLAEMRSSKTIAVDCEGVNLGREGQLTLIQVATAKKIYIVDILSLGMQVFDRGFRDILESGDILKIMFDCRKDSDALFHLYKTRLANVFDCQVADLIIRRNFTGLMPAYVRGMSGCLRNYLNFSEEDLEQKSAGKLLMEDNELWSRRPLTKAMLDYAAFDVAFLHTLRNIMVQLLNFELHVAMDKYLSVVRDENMDTGHIVPEFQSDVLRHMFRDMRVSYQHRPRLSPAPPAPFQAPSQAPSQDLAPPAQAQVQASTTTTDADSGPHESE